MTWPSRLLGRSRILQIVLVVDASTERAPTSTAMSTTTSSEIPDGAWSSRFPTVELPSRRPSRLRAAMRLLNTNTQTTGRLREQHDRQ